MAQHDAEVFTKLWVYEQAAKELRIASALRDGGSGTTVFGCRSREVLAAWDKELG